MASRLQEALQVTSTALHYADALIARSPLDSPEIYNTAFDQAEILQDHERAAVYMQRQMEHFPDLRADALQKLAIVHFAMSKAYAFSTWQKKICALPSPSRKHPSVR